MFVGFLLDTCQEPSYYICRSAHKTSQQYLKCVHFLPVGQKHIYWIKENELNLTCQMASVFLSQVSKIYSYHLRDETLGICSSCCEKKDQKKNTDSAEIELSWIADLWFLTLRRLE